MQAVKMRQLPVIVFALVLINISVQAANDTIPENVLLNQRSIGGWPQFYPDVSIYRSQITYNGNATINTMNVLNDVALRVNNQS